MGYKKIGVVGATGLVGKEITRALVDAGFEVTPFSRQKTTVAGIPTQDLGSFQGFDVIISAVGHAGMKDQLSLIEQAKKDGVKRFVPSEFGVHPESPAGSHAFFQAKRDIRQAVEQAEFPDGWTALASGFFDGVLAMFIKVDKSTLTIRGDGETKYPFTMRYDLGRVLAETFKAPEAYKNRWLTVVNTSLSMSEIAQQIKDEAGKDLSVQRLETDAGTPVLHLLEKNGLTILPPEVEEPPVQLSDFGQAIRAFVDKQLS